MDSNWYLWLSGHFFQVIRSSRWLRGCLSQHHRPPSRQITRPVLRGQHESSGMWAGEASLQSHHGRGWLQEGPRQDPTAQGELCLLQGQAGQDGLHRVRSQALAYCARHVLFADKMLVSSNERTVVQPILINKQNLWMLFFPHPQKLPSNQVLQPSDAWARHSRRKCRIPGNQSDRRSSPLLYLGSAHTSNAWQSTGGHRSLWGRLVYV